MTQYDYTIQNKEYEGTVGVPRVKIEDDQYGVYTPLMEEMGNAAARHPDELLFALVLLGASTVCYDGQYFFDTDHPVAATTASNYDATGGGALWMLLDTNRPLKPFLFQMRKKYKFDAKTKRLDDNVFWEKELVYGVDGRMNVGFGFWQQAYGSLNTLNSTNFEAYRATMEALEGDEGQKLGIKPNLLVCGPSNRAAAEELLKREQLAGSGTNVHFKAVDLLVTPYLT
jgi:phage major head subunit gpT-like protein